MEIPILILRAMLVGLLVTATAACSDNDDDTSPSGVVEEATSAAIDWQPCSTNANLDCATLEVPLIHDSTDTRTLSLSLNRLPSTGTSPRLLMLNPGGPGGSGTGVLEFFDSFDIVPTELREAFDLVGFDPRGVGGSDRIDCSEFLTDAMRAGYAATRSDIETLVADTTAFSAACSEKYGDRLNWLGSNQVVGDMDMIRVANRSEKLDFLGFSYGSRLAALYLQKFPDSSGRILMDGVISPDSSLDFLVEGTAVAYQSNLQRLFDDCELTANKCDASTIEAILQTRIATLIADNDPALGVFASLLAKAAHIFLAARDSCCNNWCWLGARSAFCAFWRQWA
ncbi:alpha/beta hydrolase [Granulosicoccus sp.]|nr:alpha/beta hydrolase [Granulosicoccus sp.]